MTITHDASDLELTPFSGTPPLSPTCSKSSVADPAAGQGSDMAPCPLDPLLLVQLGLRLGGLLPPPPPRPPPPPTSAYIWDWDVYMQLIYIKFTNPTKSQNLPTKINNFIVKYIQWYVTY